MKNEIQYTDIETYEYDIMEHGAINAIRIYETPDPNGGVKAAIKTALHYRMFINWLDGKERRSLLEYGANGYTLIYDDRDKMPWLEM